MNVCLLDSELGLCVGCGRTIGEIASWTSISDAERAAIMAALPARLESFAKSESETA
ncbi:MAG: DUF1289 domain-containing protein [Methyloceanibacter sp.]